MNLPLNGLTRRFYPTAQDARVGDTHEWLRTFDETDIEHTGAATRDHNPIHFDPAYAAKTRFKRPILHGVATLGEISRVLGTEFPGRGTIFVSLLADFKRPIYPGDTVEFTAEIKEVDESLGKIALSVIARVAEKTVLEARSVVILEHDPEALQ